MGNNSSSSHQYCASNGPSHEIGRGWTQSFPRELARHHPQQPGHKVLPEPPNQRLRATNNGSIIHNGGTISGRRPPALTLPHDLNKQGIFRSRSTSASNIGASRGRRLEQHRCCHHRNESCCMENEMQELKRFGSEPDLRYSPMERETRCNGKQHAMEHRHCGSGHYPERDSRERESRYKGKKKYKAPAPPSNGLVDGLSPDSYRYTESSQDRPGGCRGEEEVQPQPPRRSRLFKTRAETKRAQVNWLSSSALSSQANAERCENINGSEHDRRWRGGEDGRNGNKENRLAWRNQSNHHQQERWCREEQKRLRILDGKNTLQRSMSSPEFQAELMQVARKVRNKLNCGGRSSVDSAKVASLERASDADRCAKEPKVEESKRPEKRSARNEEGSPEEQRVMIEDRMVEERRLIERCARSETKMSVYEERKGNARDHPARITKDYLEERQAEAGSGGKRRLVEKSTTFEESSALLHRENPREPARKDAKDHLDLAARHPAVGERSFPSEKERRELMEDYQRAKSVAKTRKYEQTMDPGRSRSESPAIKACGRDRVSSSDPRGQGSGRESTPERTEAKEREKENSDRRWRKSDARNTDGVADERRWPEPVPATEKRDAKSKEKLARKAEAKEAREKNWHVLPSPEKSAPKTFYFGMDDALSNEPRNCVDQQMEQIQARLQVAREVNGSSECMLDYTDDGKSGVEDISLKLRPTLPKKQLEIPRFSPSAAWRLLSALEAPGPTMSTASEEIPVMFEERIERLSRPPPPLIALGPRSSHDKSGDSGISGDAGAANDDSLDVSTTNRLKTPATRPTWTPQQDLGEESSSDAGVDSPPPMPTPVKFPPRAHVFSLSLPRDDNRMYLYNPDMKGKEGSTFNSLQKLKRSVSGALGLGPLDLERKRTRDVLDDNWLLSTSAPTSLQHTQITDATRSSPPGWKPNFDDEDDDDEILEVDLEDRGDFPVIMKPPSFSYLASGGHVMYLPESNDSQYQPQSLNCRSNVMTDNEKNSVNNGGPKYRKNGVDEFRKPSKDAERTNKYSKDSSTVLKDKPFASDGKMNNKFSKSCENISSEMKQRSSSPPTGGQQQNLQDDKEIAPEVKLPLKSNSKGRRFTFQSTVRQIERRRLAEKLSREAEAKERQRKGELEAMRKVEEEFQRKRAREKANIRQQLRLYSMDENLSSLPTVWDSSQLSRADPDGAPSSSASSPTSVPPAKLTTIRKSSVSSDEYLRKRAPSADSRQHQHQHHQQQQQPQQREYKDYRPKYYDWAPESSSHLEYKQTTVHPKVVCDIPKSAPVFVDANPSKGANPSSTPRSDNYRKDFAHGAVAARSSLASSDSELSQPNTRPHSRQAGGKSKPARSRKPRPERRMNPSKFPKNVGPTTPSLANIQVEFESILNENSSDEEESGVQSIPTSQSRALQVQRNGSSSATHFENFSDRDEIILAMIWSNNHLGAAYYNILTSELSVMDDTYDDGVYFNITKALYRQCQPHYVITISGTSEEFLAAIEALVTSQTTSSDPNMSTSSSEGLARVSLKVMRKKEHSFDRCYHRVRCLKLQSEPANANNVERLVFLQGLLNFKSIVMIHALGLLLIYVDQHWGNLALDPSGKPNFVSLTSVMLRDIVMIDDDTYEALNIVHAKHHPSLFKCGDVASKRQSGSLFTLLNRCQSRPGAQFLWKTLRHPTRNIEILDARFEVVEFCLEPDNQSTVETLTSCLKHLYRLTNVTLDRYLAQQAKISDWRRLYKTVSSIIYIADVCEKQRNKARLFGKIVDSVTNEVRYVKYFLEYIVDFSAKRSGNDFIVRPNVDSHLDKLHHMRSTLPQTLTQMGEKDMREHLPPSVTTCKMVYIPNIGYLMAITGWNPSPGEDIDLPNLEFKFVSNNIRYYKSPSAKELDDTIGDILLRINKRESYIMLKLVKYINKHATSIFSAIQLCAELDTLLAFHVVAREHNYVKPCIVERQIIAVEEGRHPLQEFATTTFVCNDTHSGNGKSLVKILTGPNASGKSTYLKQVALIAFMAHIGCYVPAKSATIGIVTHILTQLTSMNSVALNTSTFLEDMRQINSALYASTPNSIVILDEFGNGTSEMSGLSLLAAVLNNFIERGVYCPHVFVATHMHRVINMLPHDPIIEEQTFEFITNDDGTVAYLYRLTSGHATRSFAHAAARSAGLDEQVVKRALEVYDNFKAGELPSRLPAAQKQEEATRIIQRMLESDNFGVEFLEELKLLIHQFMGSAAKKS